MAEAVGSAVGRAAQLLPSFSLRRRASSGADLAPEPAAPLPVSVPVLLLCGDEAMLGAGALTEQSTLLELQSECQRVAGVQPTLQRLCILGAA